VGTALAIDFGSSNTAAAYRDASGRIIELRLSSAGSLMPSCVFRLGDRTLVGSSAFQARLTDPGAFEPAPKRRLADGEVMLGNELVPATDLVAAVLTEVVARAQRVSGSEADEVILTHPDKWGPGMQGLLRTAAIAAGISPSAVRLVTEATAAAWFYTA
jgi:molecular chaperone DnaK